MKNGKSLRQLAKEINVSPSYLSQAMMGKRPASKKVLSKLLVGEMTLIPQNLNLAGAHGSRTHRRHY